MTTVWQELGIDPTDDAALIKSAYAAKLKVTRPDESPEAFQRLRAAYTAALQMVGQRELAVVPTAQPPFPAETIEDLPTEASPLKTAAAGALTERDRTLTALRQIFSGNDGEAAIAAIDDAIARQTLSFDREQQYIAALIDVLQRDRKIPAVRLREIADRFGWYGVPDQMRGHNGRKEHLLCARIDAELWWGTVKRQAKNWTYWIGQREPAAARLVTGSGSIGLSWIAMPDPPLSRTLAEALLHAPHLNEAIDTDRLARIQRIVLLRRKRRFQSALALFKITLMLVLTLAGLYFDPRTGAGVIILASVWYRYGGYFRPKYRTDLIFPVIAMLWIAVMILGAGAIPPGTGAR